MEHAVGEPHTGGISKREGAGWLATLVVVGVVLPLVGYESRDPDSQLYAAIAAEMSTVPLDHWIAPEWWGNWNSQGPFREHPVGIFLPSSLLARLGFPALQAAYVVNAVYQVLTLVAIQRLAAFYVPGAAARSLAWIVQLLPIAFAYRIRANHEQAVLLCLIVALYATVQSRSDRRWIIVTTLAFVYMFLVKGILMAFAPLACAWLILLSRGAAPSRTGNDTRAWAGLVVAVVITGAVAVMYEGAYQRATGESFYAYYLGKWTSLGLESGAEPLVMQKVSNFLWYLGRLVWFAFPWSLVACWTIWGVRDDLARLWRRAYPGEAAGHGSLALDGFLIGLGIVVLYIGLLSLSNHRADRYLFPAYTLLGVCGAAAAIQTTRVGQRVALAMDRWHPYTPMVMYLVGFGLSVAANLARLPRPT